jgi:hypothetical protein
VDGAFESPERIIKDFKEFVFSGGDCYSVLKALYSFGYSKER